jgi:hypothetical protein
LKRGGTIGGGSGATAACATGAGAGSTSGSVIGGTVVVAATTGGGSGTFSAGCGACIRTVFTGSVFFGRGSSGGGSCDVITRTIIGFTLASARCTGACWNNAAITATWTTSVTTIPA